MISPHVLKKSIWRLTLGVGFGDGFSSHGVSEIYTYMFD